jgi:hypothetical protein
MKKVSILSLGLVLLLLPAAIDSAEHRALRRKRAKG